MPFLADSDWVIDYLNDVPEALDLFGRLAQEGLSISIVTYMEAYEGVVRDPRPEEREQRLEAFLLNTPIIPLSPVVARRCALLRDSLRRQGRRVHQRAIDLIIAATALEHDLTLVTRNTEDYGDIPGLKIHRSAQ